MVDETTQTLMRQVVFTLNKPLHISLSDGNKVMVNMDWSLVVYQY